MCASASSITNAAGAPVAPRSRAPLAIELFNGGICSGDGGRTGGEERLFVGATDVVEGGRCGGSGGPHTERRGAAAGGARVVGCEVVDVVVVVWVLVVVAPEVPVEVEVFPMDVEDEIDVR